VDSCAVISNPFRIGNQLVERVLLAGAYTDRCSSGCHRGQRSVFDVVTKYIDGICGPGRRLWQRGCHDALACGAPDSQRDNRVWSQAGPKQGPLRVAFCLACATFCHRVVVDSQLARRVRSRWTAGLLAITNENCTPWRVQALITVRVPYAESPRTRICPFAPASRAVLTAWATMRRRPCLCRSRQRVAHPRDHRCLILVVLIVVASGESPLRRTCFPAILV